MSDWSGFDDDNEDQNAPLSAPSSPFSTAFRTPSPPGIQAGVRDVPPALSEHPEDPGIAAARVP